jgi:hypothetical protein
VLELRQTSAAVIGCFAKADALDAVAIDETLGFRVAPDELLLLSAPDRAAEVRGEAEAALARSVGALVVDVTDGYSVWSLRGAWREPFTRLCAIAIPEDDTCLQGLFAEVPAKLVVSTEVLLIVTPSVVSRHVEARVRGSCADLDLTSGAPMPVAVPVREDAA